MKRAPNSPEELAEKLSARVIDKNFDKTRFANEADQERYFRNLEVIAGIRTFNYGVGSDYANGILGHEDILQLTDFLLQNRPLFRRVVALNFPFVFIDESQDTFPSVVKSFKEVEAQMRRKFCLVFLATLCRRSS